MQKNVQVQGETIPCGKASSDVGELFRYFAVLYGSRWTKTVPRNSDGLIKSKAVWFYALKNFSHEQVGEALKFIQDGRTGFTDFPPNPTQFSMLCKMIIKNSFKNLKRLNIKSANPEVARDNLKKCWEKLGVKSHEAKF